MQSKKSLLILFSFILLVVMIACSMPTLNIANEDEKGVSSRDVPQMKFSITPTIQQMIATPAIVISESEIVEYKPIHDADFLFFYDPDIWYEIGDFMGVGIMLEHKTLEGCFIVDPRLNGHELHPYANPELKYFNGKNWMKSYFDMYTYLGDERLYLELGNFRMHMNPECREAQEAVLETLHIEGEHTVRETPCPTYTPTPEFVCPNAPEVIHRVDAYSYTLTTVLLRSTPEKKDDNIIAHLESGTQFKIKDGPVCGPYVGGAYAYFFIHILDGDYAGVDGWLAEGDLHQYYMADYGGGP